MRVVPLIASNAISTPTPEVSHIDADAKEGVVAYITPSPSPASDEDATPKCFTSELIVAADTSSSTNALRSPVPERPQSNTCFTTEVIEAVTSNDSKQLLALLMHGHAVDEQDCYGRTPLHYAVTYGCFTCFCILLLAAANPNIADANGKTPLHVAMRFYAQCASAAETDIDMLLSLECVIKQLLWCGADPLLRTNTDRTAWDCLDGVDDAYLQSLMQEVDDEWLDKTREIYLTCPVQHRYRTNNTAIL
jgi:hypothetical protein